MGKGDRKTAKGKRFNSSYGNVRKAVTKAAGAVAAPVVKKATTKSVAKVPAKKVVAKPVLSRSKGRPSAEQQAPTTGATEKPR